ncbi:hypothetical protein DNTS_007072, partial [Danionella cerebrum]
MGRSFRKPLVNKVIVGTLHLAALSVQTLFHLLHVVASLTGSLKQLGHTVGGGHVSFGKPGHITLHHPHSTFKLSLLLLHPPLVLLHGLTPAGCTQTILMVLMIRYKASRVEAIVSLHPHLHPVQQGAASLGMESQFLPYTFISDDNESVCANEHMGKVKCIRASSPSWDCPHDSAINASNCTDISEDGDACKQPGSPDSACRIFSASPGCLLLRLKCNSLQMPLRERRGAGISFEKFKSPTDLSSASCSFHDDFLICCSCSPAIEASQEPELKALHYRLSALISGRGKAILKVIKSTKQAEKLNSANPMSEVLLQGPVRRDGSWVTASDRLIQMLLSQVGIRGRIKLAERQQFKRQSVEKTSEQVSGAKRVEFTLKDTVINRNRSLTVAQGGWERAKLLDRKSGKKCQHCNPYPLSHYPAPLVRASALMQGRCHRDPHLSYPDTARRRAEAARFQTLSTLPGRLNGKNGTFSDGRQAPHESVISGHPGSARSERVQMRNERGLAAMAGEDGIGKWDVRDVPKATGIQERQERVDGPARTHRRPLQKSAIACAVLEQPVLRHANARVKGHAEKVLRGIERLFSERYDGSCNRSDSRCVVLLEEDGEQGNEEGCLGTSEKVTSLEEVCECSTDASRVSPPDEKFTFPMNLYVIKKQENQTTLEPGRDVPHSFHREKTKKIVLWKVAIDISGATGTDITESGSTGKGMAGTAPLGPAYTESPKSGIRGSTGADNWSILENQQLKDPGTGLVASVCTIREMVRIRVDFTNTPMLSVNLIHTVLYEDIVKHSRNICHQASLSLAVTELQLFSAVTLSTQTPLSLLLVAKRSSEEFSPEETSGNIEIQTVLRCMLIKQRRIMQYEVGGGMHLICHDCNLPYNEEEEAALYVDGLSTIREYPMFQDKEFHKNPLPYSNARGHINEYAWSRLSRKPVVWDEMLCWRAAHPSNLSAVAGSLPGNSNSHAGLKLPTVVRAALIPATKWPPGEPLRHKHQLQKEQGMLGMGQERCPTDRCPDTRGDKSTTHISKTYQQDNIVAVQNVPVIIKRLANKVMSSIRVECVIKERNAIGESPVWEERDSSLLYVDITGRKICRWSSLTKTTETIST